jgi:hypothetical protein
MSRLVESHVATPPTVVAEATQFSVLQKNRHQLIARAYVLVSTPCKHLKAAVKFFIVPM